MISVFQAGLRHGLLLAALVAMNVHAAGAATAAASGAMVAIQPLTKYVLPDQTASVMLPDGWHVTQTDVAFFRAEGPNGELAMFGVTVPAHDATGTGGPPLERLIQPYGADPGDKLNQSIQWVRAANHLSPVTVIKIYSNQPFAAPKEFGSCSTMTATLGVGGSVLDAEADRCSLPVDGDGNYVNFLKIVAISPALAKSERSTVEAALASYVLNMKALQQQQQAEQAAGRSIKMASVQGPAVKSPAKQRSSMQSPVAPQGRQSLQQQINSEIKAGGFSPQMVAAMRAQANANAAIVMGPAMRQLQASDQAVDYFDRTTLRGQIPVSIANQGTFWVDTN